MLKGIIFDKDGVLVDFEKTWGWVLGDMAQKLGRGDVGLTEKLEEIAGFDRARGEFTPGSIWAAGNTHDLLAVWKPLLPAFSREELEGFMLQICNDVAPHPVVSVEVMKPMFASLAGNNVQLGVATNDSELSARRTLEQFGFSDLFRLILGYDSVENPKPAADPVFAFCQHCGLEPAHVAVVGDNAHDMEMALAAGAGVRIGVLSGNSTANELLPLCDFMVDDISQLPQALEERRLLGTN